MLIVADYLRESVADRSVTWTEKRDSTKGSDRISDLSHLVRVCFRPPGAACGLSHVDGATALGGADPSRRPHPER
jgi:hypothetical protein